MKKVDFKKVLKYFYEPSAKEVVEIDVPTMKFLMMDGEGDPNTSHAFSEDVEALFSVSYTNKFNIKKGRLEIDYGVMLLEGLWWADDMSQWKTVIRQPMK